MEWEIGEDEEFCDFDTYVTELGEINGPDTVAILNDHSVFHALTKTDMFDMPKPTATKSSVFLFNDRYSSGVFQGIMPDSGAAGVSTAGQPQFLALQKLDPRLQIDTTTAGRHKVRFGKGDVKVQLMS